jgi:translation initiation factor 1A
MPNLQGGKKYKSSKHAQEPKVEIHEVGEGQMVGRVVKNLGNRRMLVYCNDTKERICKLRGALRKKIWINVGDIILLSLRDLASGTTGTSENNTGDILAKYDTSILSKLKKEDGMNPKVFIQDAVNSTEVLDSLFEAESESSEEEVDIDTI